MKKKRLPLIVAFLFAAFLAWLGLDTALRYHWIPGQQIPILNFHEIGNQETNRRLTTEKFIQMMDYLKKKGFRPISLEDYIAILKKQKPKGRLPIVLTFDDGEISHYAEAYPALKERGFTANFCILPDFVGQRRYLALRERIYSIEKPDLPEGKFWEFQFMDWKQIQTMQEDGMHFHSHTMNHNELLKLDAAALSHQIEGSKKHLERKLGREVRFLAYPWGEYDARIQEKTRQAGYLAGLSSDRESTVPDEAVDLFAIGRYSIFPTTSLRNFKITAWGMTPIKLKVKAFIKKPIQRTGVWKPRATAFSLSRQYGE